MKWLARRCVNCGVLLETTQILAAGRFQCPGCHTWLQAPKSYAHKLGLGNLLFSVVLFRALGLTGLHLVYAVLLAWLPFQYVAANVVKYIIPPEIMIYGSKGTTLGLRDGPHSKT
jgi:hypothetical protein